MSKTNLWQTIGDNNDISRFYHHTKLNITESNTMCACFSGSRKMKNNSNNRNNSNSNATINATPATRIHKFHLKMLTNGEFRALNIFSIEWIGVFAHIRTIEGWIVAVVWIYHIFIVVNVLELNLCASGSVVEYHVLAFFPMNLFHGVCECEPQGSGGNHKMCRHSIETTGVLYEQK